MLAQITVKNLNGARVALLESRHSETMAQLVERYGGRPYAVPALREEPVDSERLARLVHGIARGRFSTVVFQTGAAAQRLFDEAARLGMTDAVAQRLARCITVSRGPKPAAVLWRYGVRAGLTIEEPYTTQELLSRLSALDVSRKYVALLHYGERNRELSLVLRTRGARLAEFLLYEWRLPADIGPLQALVADVIDGSVDAVAFTNKVQVRHLYRVAEMQGRGDELATALARRVVVASIGPSCTHGLLTLGIRPAVVPPIPKMRPLIAALSDYIAGARTHANAS